MRRDAFVDRIQVRSVRKTNINVSVFEPESRVNIRSNFVVGFDDILDVQINEVVERVDMLLNESLYFQKCREQQPFVLYMHVSALVP